LQAFQVLGRVVVWVGKEFVRYVENVIGVGKVKTWQLAILAKAL
jgi:hypothetical protein